MPIRRVVIPLIAIGFFWLALPPIRADLVRMKNDLVYRGLVHHEDTIYQINDGIKRVIVRDSKVAKFERDTSLRTLESFHLEQPVEPRGGPMPDFVLGVKAAPFDEYGQRGFSYVNTKQRPFKLTQGIVDMNPHFVKVQGLTSSWQAPLATSRVGKPVILGLLARVDSKNENERRRVCQFMIQAEWYAEARAELDRLAVDFPSAVEGARAAKEAVLALEATKSLAEIDQAVRAQQPQAALARLTLFSTDGIPPDVAVDVRNRLRNTEDRRAADDALAAELRKRVEGLPEESREPWENPLVEILQVLAEAPDAARTRLEAFSRALTDPDAPDDHRLGLAFSGWVVGGDKAVPDLAAAEALWKARAATQVYLSGRPDEDRNAPLSTLNDLTWTEGPDQIPRKVELETLTRIARLLPPIRPSERQTPGKPLTIRVADDGNAVPTEYSVLLPPEYHPVRVYPAVLALHNGLGPQSAISWLEEEAARRGYILIAPEYNLPGRAADYRYTTSEHAAAVLALRDAKRRFAIDSDRVYLAGQLLGANMCWDFGLCHPDLFAGVVMINGLPAKYVGASQGHAKLLPLYIVMGDLAPAAGDVISQLAKNLIVKNYDVTHVEYHKRGLEELPEETPAAFDWMDRHRREPHPKSFRCTSARTCDDRFYGVVVREFVAGRTQAPEAVEMLGKNLHPATLEVTTSTLANLVNVVKADGIRRADIWLSPEIIDFSKRLEVRYNGKPAFKGLAKLDFSVFLDDLRQRGDRQQIYWMRVPVGR